MFLWIIKQVAISLVIIVLLHYLYIFLKYNLTIPKVKDLIVRPERKYKEIYKSLDKDIVHEKSVQPINTPVDMKTELKNYLKGLKPDGITASNTTEYNSYERL